MGKTQRYEIIRHAPKTQTKPNTKTKDITILTLKYYIPLCLQDQDHDMADSSSPSNNKRSPLIIHQHSQPKKTRCDLQADHDQYANQALWLGFQMLELLAKDIATEPIEINTSIRELIHQGFKENEAAELYTTKISYPRVQQKRWPSSRQDGRTGHHYHLTQVPSDIDINTSTGFPLVYHILLNFEKPSIAYTSLEVIEMTKTRFQKMGIELGELREPIAPLCNSKNDTWNGLTRVHLRTPEVDGNALLEGTRIFSLELTEETTVAKVSRGFDNIAANDDLTLKVSSKSLPTMPSHKLFELVVRDNFRCNKEYEITQVLKEIDQDHAYVVAASPEQRSKIMRFSLAIEGEIIAPTPTRVKLSTAEIAKKNCLVLIAKNLNKGLTPEQIESGLRTLIGEKNVVSVYFPRAEAGLHAGIANVEFLNAPIYKKFVGKTHKLQNKYIKFNPHPRSLNGSAAPSEESLKELGFCDVNTALASTVEALEFATAATRKSGVPKDEISALLKDAIAEGNQTLKQELKVDMQNMRENILAESHTYTDIMTQDLRSRIEGQFDTIDNQFKALMESLSITRRMLNDSPQLKALPSTEHGQSN
jgi:hypothetical protein